MYAIAAALMAALILAVRIILPRSTPSAVGLTYPRLFGSMVRALSDGAGAPALGPVRGHDLRRIQRVLDEPGVSPRASPLRLRQRDRGAVRDHRRGRCPGRALDRHLRRSPQRQVDHRAGAVADACGFRRFRRGWARHAWRHDRRGSHAGPGCPVQPHLEPDKDLRAPSRGPQPAEYDLHGHVLLRRRDRLVRRVAGMEPLGMERRLRGRRRVPAHRPGRLPRHRAKTSPCRQRPHRRSPTNHS